MRVIYNIGLPEEYKDGYKHNFCPEEIYNLEEKGK